MRLKISVDGKTYEVDVEVAEQEHPIYGVGAYTAMSPVRVPAPMPAAAGPGIVPAAAAGEVPAAPVNEEKVCRSPISGIVTRITAQSGQHIQPEDPILVLEAMKMETAITAPMAGKIKTINVNAGDSVQGGQILVEFE